MEQQDLVAKNWTDTAKNGIVKEDQKFLVNILFILFCEISITQIVDLLSRWECSYSLWMIKRKLDRKKKT